MIILMTAALAAAQPAPAAAPPSDAQHQQMEHKGTTRHMAHMGHMGMGHMGHMGHMRMSEKQMAECHRYCERMMARMHHGHAQHKRHAG